MHESIAHALQSYASKEEYHEDDVGESRRYVDNFAGGGDAFNHAHVDQDPGDDQGEGDLVVESLRVVYVFGNLKCGAVPEVLRWTAYL